MVIGCLPLTLRYKQTLPFRSCNLHGIGVCGICRMCTGSEQASGDKQEGAGRKDAVMYDDLSLKYIITGSDIENIGSIETNENLGIAVRKDDRELLEKLNPGLTNLMNDPYGEELKIQYDMVI